MEAVSPLSWFGGKYLEEQIPFAQFGVDPTSFFTIYQDLTVPPAQLKAFQEDKASCVIGIFMNLKFDWGKLYCIVIPVSILAVMMIIVLLPDLVLGWHYGLYEAVDTAAATSGR